MLVRKLLFISFLFFTFYNISLTQDFGTLRGLVTDSTSGEALAYGNVFIKELGKGASTDSHGYFLIPHVPADKNFTLILSYVGYKTKTISIKLIKNKITHYDIKLVPSGVELQTIEKLGERVIQKNETDISLQRIAVRDLEALPQGVETDIFRSLQYMPGVQSTGDVSARFFVRGGAANQNLVLIDGVTVYNPFHALGLFSVIDPDMINNIEFYKGGFGADLGGRLSSVTKIITKDGNKNNYSAKASASLLSGKLLLEGPLPHGSFIFTGRKSYSNQIIKKFLNEQNVPVDFYDFFFKANYTNPDFVQGAKFTVNGFFSGDNIKNNDPTVEDFKWSNNIFGFKWFQVGDNRLFYELGVSASEFKGDVIPKYSNVRKTNNKVEDVTLMMDITYMFESKDELGLGFHVKHVKTDLYIENDRAVPSSLNESGANITFYSKYKFLRFDWLGIDAGVRVNLTNLSRNANAAIFEPRLNFNLSIIPQLSLKGAWGIYQQEMATFSDENSVINIFEPWIISPDYIGPSKSTQYIMGLEAKVVPSTSLTVEGYYKISKDIPYINDQKTFVSDPDFIGGDGESYGIETSLKIFPQPINFTASYTLAYAYKEINGLLYYPRYDIRHSVNLILNVNLGNGWSAGSVWTYNSGLPFTQVLGYYDKYYFQDIFAPWNELDPRFPYRYIGVQNLGRLPDYHRLDLTLSKKFKFDVANVDIDLSVINVYNRKNIFYFKRDNGERVNMLPILPTASVKVEL